MVWKDCLLKDWLFHRQWGLSFLNLQKCDIFGDYSSTSINLEVDQHIRKQIEKERNKEKSITETKKGRTAEILKSYRNSDSSGCVFKFDISNSKDFQNTV